LREARAAAKLRHSNVASVLHLGKSAGNYFYAMEFVEGETLDHLIKRSGRQDVKLALEIAAQVAAGLAAVHEQNLVHRDIKPTNIMVRLKEDRSVTAKIIDLGLAKTLDESASEAGISLPGGFVGTPEFASPEQFAGVQSRRLAPMDPLASEHEGERGEDESPLGHQVTTGETPASEITGAEKTKDILGMFRTLSRDLRRSASYEREADLLDAILKTNSFDDRELAQELGWTCSQLRKTRIVLGDYIKAGLKAFPNYNG
jgi:serine/threonine protein kinase